MKPEYDFSQGERGKFYRPDARIHLPVDLEEPVRGTRSAEDLESDKTSR